LKPIYYYKHPFNQARGGHLKTGLVWKDDVCYCHHSNLQDFFESHEMDDRTFTLISEAADMGLHDDDKSDDICIGFPHQPSIYRIKRSDIPKGLKNWYSTNVNLKNPTFGDGKKIECCPIGVYEGYHNNCAPTGDLERRMAAPMAAKVNLWVAT